MIVNKNLLEMLRKNESVDCLVVVDRYGRDEIRSAILGVFEKQNKNEYLLLKDEYAFRENYFKLLTFYLLSEEKQVKYTNIGKQRVRGWVTKNPLPDSFHDNLLKLKDEIRTALIPSNTGRLAEAC